MKKRQGISLIVLIITIIVVIILAAAIILTLNNNNPISSAKEAKFKEDIRAFQDELEMYKANRIIADENVVNITADKNSNPSIQDIITSMNDEYASKLKIQNGNLMYVQTKGSSLNEYNYAKSLGLTDEYELLDDEIFEELQTFITEWTVEAGDSITLPLTGYAHNKYNFTVDYGDNTGILEVTSGSDEDRIHKYSNAGTYTVTIKGQCPDFSFSGNSGNTQNQTSISKDKITKIVQWGSVFKNEGGLQISLNIDFANCTNLCGPIPDPSKNTFKNVTGIPKLFSGCTSLKCEIPEKLLYNCPKITSVALLFNNSGITGEIPENLFKKCDKVTSFNNTFANCNGLTGSIPEDLFSNCTQAKDFNGTFMTCSNITGDIPENLFKNCVNVTSFYRVFDGCTNLDGNLSEKMFDNNVNVTSFGYAFRCCSKLNGKAPELWNRENISGLPPFIDCKKLSNYADIPVGWK